MRQFIEFHNGKIGGAIKRYIIDHVFRYTEYPPSFGSS